MCACVCVCWCVCARVCVCACARVRVRVRVRVYVFARVCLRISSVQLTQKACIHVRVCARKGGGRERQPS